MNASKSYNTIIEPANAEIMEKGSKFIAYLEHTSNEEDIKTFILKIKREHPKARHWCFAYRLGHVGDKWKTSDDGEPRGTAGKPILNQIDSANLTDVTLVIARYFGGTLLGTSGLIKAYKQASKACIDRATCVPSIAMQYYRIESNATRIMQLMGILKETGVLIDRYSFTESFVEFNFSKDQEAFIFRKLKSNLEKINLDHIKDYMQLVDCKIIRQ